MKGGDIVLTIEEVSKILKISYRSAWLMVVAGKIKAIRVGNQWRISEDEIERIKKEGA
jgi:excisionase family DNA binding protein